MWLATFTRQMRSHASSGASTPPTTMIPALAQKRSIGPKASSVRRTSSRTSAATPASTRSATAGTPVAPSISAATRSAWSPSMSATTTARASSAAKARASASPMPPPPPVTTATLPWSFTFGPLVLLAGGRRSGAPAGHVPGDAVGVLLELGVLGEEGRELLAGRRLLVRQVLGGPQALVWPVALQHIAGDRHLVHLVDAVHDAHRRRAGPHRLQRGEVGHPQ